LGQVAQIDKELGIERINPAVTKLDWIQRVKTIDDRHIQPKADAYRLDGVPFQPRVMDSGAGRVARQDAEQKEVQHKNKKYGEERPP
jgi:hypothetical protein